MGRMADAEKLSIPQLQMAIKNGTIPAYVGVPLLQDKMRQHQQAMASQQGQQQQAPIAAQVMQDADQYRGIDELPTNLPTAEDDQTVDDEYANGGIIAFADEGQVRDPDNYDVNNFQTDRDMGNAMRKRGQSFLGSVGEELGNFGRFIKNPFSSKDPKANYMRELEDQADRPLTEQELQLNRRKEANNFRDEFWNSPEGKKLTIEAQQRGERTTFPPSKVMQQYYNMQQGDSKKGLEKTAEDLGISTSDVLRMQAAQPNAFQQYMREKFPSLVNDATTGSFAGNSKVPTPTPSTVKDVPFVKSENPETGVALPYRRQKGNLTATPPDLSGRERELIPKQDVNLAELNAPYTPAVTPKRISEAEAARAEMLKAEAASPMGVAALPNAQNVQTAPGQRGASTTAPASGAGGEKLTPKVGLENAPSTLAKAEAVAGKSPAAAQAVSMLDEFIADLKKSGQNVSRDKKEALYIALIKGGLAAAGGTSPNALANIAAGMVPAIEGYSKDIAGIRKDERARLEKLVAAGVSKEKIGLEARKLGITEKHYDDWYKAETAKLGVMSGSRADARAQAEDLKRLSVAQSIFGTLKKDQLMSGASDEDLWAKAQVMSGQIEAPAAPKSNVMGSYIPGKGYVPAGK
jgi:hypothetical protein